MRRIKMKKAVIYDGGGVSEKKLPTVNFIVDTRNRDRSAGV
jgi:hypothetical protein